MARVRLDKNAIDRLTLPTSGSRVDYDIPNGPRDKDFVRGFAIRTTANGAKVFVLCYTTQSGRERRHRIGDYPAHSAASARKEARKLRLRVDAGEDPFATEKLERVNAEAKRAQDIGTFGGLLNAYVASLRRAKKLSADSIETDIERNVQRAFPGLWKRPASSVTLDELVAVLNRLTRSGKHRAAGKLRAYIRAAYNSASASRGNAAASDLFERYVALPNIARDLAAIKPHKPEATEGSADPDVLSLAELRAYWARIKDQPTKHGALLRAHLLLGGQRCEQLARITRNRIDRDALTVMLFDPKGRRAEPRPHLVPLLPETLAAFDALAGDGTFAFSLDGGKHGAGYHTVRSAMQDVAEAMRKKKEVAAVFSPGWIRRTVETRLAAVGVAREVRAQLQSHGLGGVQGASYDRHGYLQEKRDALQKLRKLLDPDKPKSARASRRKT